MTAIPVQRGRRTDPVTVTDGAVEISHLRITHPEAVAIAGRELAENGPTALAETVAGAVIVGMVATGLQRSTGDTTAAMQRVLAGFDEAMQNRAAATVVQLDGLLGRIDATEQATREAAAAALAQLPIQIERGLTTALAGGAGNVREAVRQATATAQAEAVAALERVVARHSEPVRAVVSTENPSSPLAVLRHDLTTTMENARRELLEGLTAVRALVQAQQAAEAVQSKSSAAIGKDWEDNVALAVAGWVQATGDCVEHIGSTPAPGSSRRTGDVLVRIMSGSNNPVLVVEAKRRQRRPSMRAFRDELAEARRVRGAHAALAVVPTADDVPGPAGSSWARVDTASWVVAAEDAQVMMLVLGVVRELTILAAAQTGADPSVDIGRARTAVGHLRDLMARFDMVSKHLSTAEKALVNVRSTADGLRQDLAAQVQDTQRALTRGTQDG
jgi:microcompartment protein CcmL/EutN